MYGCPSLLCDHVHPSYALPPPLASLTAECALWQDTAHSLAHTVAERLSLQSIQRLQLTEKAWSKMAAHFAILLSDQDTKQVGEWGMVLGHWRYDLSR